ncbi:hypothetical protein L6452_02696 [Arctium lappa]|uniref:Uncharacterized protein n=1 Tax=Arctium lappa TaxID=4217 RepID=A0ACB9FKM9_ARCLA|nr:hypothetical protein L6452_02696 [Arctium lappa]
MMILFKYYLKKNTKSFIQPWLLHSFLDFRSRFDPVWKILWKKLKRENKGFMVRSSSVHVNQVPYDEHNYLQNFDQGLECYSPDILSRSFSVRYTDRPSVMV